MSLLLRLTRPAVESIDNTEKTVKIRLTDNNLVDYSDLCNYLPDEECSAEDNLPKAWSVLFGRLNGAGRSFRRIELDGSIERINRDAQECIDRCDNVEWVYDVRLSDFCSYWNDWWQGKWQVKDILIKYRTEYRIVEIPLSQYRVWQTIYAKQSDILSSKSDIEEFKIDIEKFLNSLSKDERKFLKNIVESVKEQCSWLFNGGDKAKPFWKWISNNDPQREFLVNMLLNYQDECGSPNPIKKIKTKYNTIYNTVKKLSFTVLFILVECIILWGFSKNYLLLGWIWVIFEILVEIAFCKIANCLRFGVFIQEIRFSVTKDTKTLMGTFVAGMAYFLTFLIVNIFIVVQFKNYWMEVSDNVIARGFVFITIFFDVLAILMVPRKFLNFAITKLLESGENRWSRRQEADQVE